MKLAMGIYDSPQEQRQPVYYVDNLRGNIAVFGGPMTGKTTFIKSFLIRLYENAERRPSEDVYIIDFGGNIGLFGQLNNVCACFDNSNEENIKRVFRIIEKRLEENSRMLGSKNYYSLARTSPRECPVHMSLIIENINAFLADERYSTYQDKLMQFCRDGLSKGLSVIFSANDTSGIGRIMANIEYKIAFDMPADSYFEIFNEKVNKPMNIPGRCIVNLEGVTYECQIFHPFDTLDDDSKIAEVIEKNKDLVNQNRMATFPEILTSENVVLNCNKEKLELLSQDEILVGLDYYEHNPVMLNAEDSRTIAIYGKRKFGKTNLLTLIVDGLASMHRDIRFIFFDDGRKELETLYAKYKDRNDTALYYNMNDFLRTLLTDGYVIKEYAPLNMKSTSIKETPFTVFVIQGKSFYNGSRESKTLLKWIAEDMLGRAEEDGYLFIFSDVRNVSDADSRTVFNNLISCAFLLDNIGEFVSDRGNKSVFGEMDAKELKAEYAKCTCGDGYFYDIETDNLRKLKFIKA